LTYSQYFLEGGFVRQLAGTHTMGAWIAIRREISGEVPTVKEMPIIFLNISGGIFFS
jgi:hypothetical protein